MPIFGQVWLWSSLAFLLGAFLCWLFVARPARNRVAGLQTKFATLARRQQAAENAVAAKRPASRDDDDDFLPPSRLPYPEDVRGDHDSLARAYVPQPARPEEPEPPSRGLSAALDGVITPPAEPEPAETELADGNRASATRYMSVSAGTLNAPEERPDNRGWFDDDLVAEPEPAAALDRRLVDDADENLEPEAELVDPADRPQPPSALADEESGTIFTQRTIPVPGELIRQLDDAEQAPAEDDSSSLIDDLADEPVDVPAAEPVAEPVVPQEESLASRLEPDAAPPLPKRSPRNRAAAHAEPPTQFVDEPTQFVEEPTQFVAEPTQFVDHETQVVGRQQTDPGGGPTEVVDVGDDRTQVVSANGQNLEHSNTETTVMPGVTVATDAATSQLPKRVPAKPTHRTPFGVQTQTTTTTAAPAVADSNQPTRSLFEPMVAAAEEKSVPPPPHRMRDGDGTGTVSGRGPFGPGSAMPLPGGGSPSPEYTIKASVTALRYCTPESPQFGRTVAEVWFRSAAEAERVGFRPVG